MSIYCSLNFLLSGKANRVDNLRMSSLHQIAGCGHPCSRENSVYPMLELETVFQYGRKALVMLVVAIATIPSSMAQSAVDPAGDTQQSNANPTREQQSQKDKKGNAKLAESYEGMYREDCSPARMRTMMAEQKAACEQIRKMGEVLRMHSK
jgi:hypothetical protein